MARNRALTVHFTDATKATGIDFVHTDGGSGKRHIVETVCCGLAIFDFDADGDSDVYFLNGVPLDGEKISPAPTNCASGPERSAPGGARVGGATPTSHRQSNESCTRASFTT